MKQEIKRYYLEINTLKELKEVKKSLEEYSLILLEPTNFQLNKFFYKNVGRKHKWIDRLVWTDTQWIDYVSNKNFKSVFHKKGAAGFGGDDEAYVAWMKAAYDGGVSTQAFLETSKLDTTKDYQVTQSTPELDGVVETTLKAKYDEHKEKCGSDYS